MFGRNTAVFKVVNVTSGNPGLGRRGGIRIVLLKGGIEVGGCGGSLLLFHTSNERVADETAHLVPFHHLRSREGAVAFRVPSVRGPLVLPLLLAGRVVDLRSIPNYRSYHHQTLDILLLHFVNV